MQGRVSGGRNQTPTLTGTAVAANILATKTAYTTDPFSAVTGTMVDRAGETAAVSTTLTGTTIKLKASEGYRDGTNDYVTVDLTTVDADHVATNIRTGITDLGVTGSLVVPTAGTASYVIDTGETITAGDAITLFDEKVKQAFAMLESETPKTDISATTISGTAGKRIIDCCVYDSTHAVIVWRNATDANTGYAVVALRTGDTISYGTKKQFETGAVSELAICKAATGKVACIYKDEGNSDRITLCIMTISTTTITSGTPLVLDTNTTTAGDGCSIDQLTTDKVICAWTGTSDNGQVACCSISGTTPTKGTTAEYHTGAIHDAIIVAMDTTHAIVVAANTGSTNSKVFGMSISGTTITLGAETAITEYYENIGMCMLSSTKAFLIFTDTADVETKCRTITLSGTTTTANTVYALGFDDMDFKCQHPYAISATKVTVTLGRGKLLLGQIFDMSGDVITKGDAVVIDNDNRNESGVAGFSATKFIAAFGQVKSNLVSSKVVTYYKMAHGVALASGTATQTISCHDWR